jgi:lupus La protein
MADANGVQERAGPSLSDQIVRQIEYYFGDINLPRDKFLQEQIKLEDGWVPLEIMLKFKRLANLTTDADVIVTALEESKLIEVSDDKKKIRRSPDLPLPVMNEERRQVLASRTVYCKGFPRDDTTLDNLLEFFSSYGPIENIQMRSFREKTTKKIVFKGSVFVLFKTKELAEEFLKKEAVKYNDEDLIRKWQSDYHENKKQEFEKNAKKSKKSKQGNQQQTVPTVKELNLPKGAILHLKGTNSDTTREIIKKTLVQEGLDVVFVQFCNGCSEAWVRLQGENSSKEYVEKLEDRKLTLCGAEVEVRCLEGDEEAEFLEKAKNEINKAKEHCEHHRIRKGGRGKGQGKGKSGFLGKRKQNAAGGGPPNKIKHEDKTEEPAVSD